MDISFDYQDGTFVSRHILPLNISCGVATVCVWRKGEYCLLCPCLCNFPRTSDWATVGSFMLDQKQKTEVDGPSGELEGCAYLVILSACLTREVCEWKGHDDNATINCTL